MSYYQRLVVEKEQLQVKQTALKSFLNSDRVKEINQNQIPLLKEQLIAMTSYLEILTKRITLLK
jgi:hypothetical protein